MSLKVFGICSKDSNAMKSDNPNSGFYEATTSRTIDSSSQSPNRNQGGMVVVEGSGTRPSHNGDGYKESEVMYTLNTVEQHSVAYGIGRPAMNQSYNAKFSFQIENELEPTIVAAGANGVAQPVYTTNKASFHTQVKEDIAATLVATDAIDPPNVLPPPYYIVRKLTPTECARLQGFPSWWGQNLEINTPTDDDVKYWQGVFDDWKSVTSPNSKSKTPKQIKKWLCNPHSDSAEYKMWGNRVALPCVAFVLSGIAHYANITT